ncbi:MAG TPA: MaoC/PaaZ C-terminal domain-containing protein [Pedococcus sp.]
MDVVTLDTAPSLPRLLARAALTARGRGGGLSSVEVRLPGVVVDRERLLAYQRVCGFGGSDVLPHTYPHVLGFPLQVALMARRDFPLALPGLVHVENVATVHRRLTADDRLDLAVRAEGLRPHPKGQVVDLVTEVDAGGARVWEGRSTYLRRGEAGAGAAAGPAAPPAPDLPPVALWRVPEGQGRAYAAVSGDVNPIHLHALTARAMGFPRAIAHGMWSAARTLAALGPSTAGASRSHVWFGRPLLLPSSVELLVEDRTHPVLAVLRSAREPGTTHLTLTLDR